MKKAASTYKLKAKIRHGLIAQGVFTLLAGLSAIVLIAHVVLIILWSTVSLVEYPLGKQITLEVFLRWLVAALLCSALLFIFRLLDEKIGEKIKRWESILAKKNV